MVELLNFFSSIKFLGIILLSGGLGFLLLPTFYGWFVSDHRHFWFSRLTYEDPQTQSMVRSTWLAGIIFLIVGAILVTINDADNHGEIMRGLFEIIYLLIGLWIILKIILLVGIIVSSLWNWCVRGTSLFK